MYNYAPSLRRMRGCDYTQLPLEDTLMDFPYKHFLVIGATSGIGLAMADRLIATGAKVTAVGRRQERLDEFVRKHGESSAHGVSFDIGHLDKIPQFAAEFVIPCS
jgi:NADP-dependent 3-hydroxy acid dehydrogenase YdfG